MANIELKKKNEKEVKLSKTYKGLYNEFANLAHFRVITGKDKRYNPIRVQKKALKHPLWPQIRNDLKIADFIEDKDAQYSSFNIYTFIIVAFLAVIFFAGLIYVMGQITTVLHNVGIQNEGNAGQPGYSNMTYAADVTFGKVNDAIKALRMVSIVYIFGLAIVIIVSSALVKIHPLFFFAYILLVILGVIFAVPISNAYYTLLGTNIFEGELTNFTGSNWILLNLPLITLIIGIAGGIFLFINLVRSPGEGSLQ